MATTSESVRPRRLAAEELWGWFMAMNGWLINHDERGREPGPNVTAEQREEIAALMERADAGEVSEMRWACTAIVRAPDCVFEACDCGLRWHEPVCPDCGAALVWD